MAVATVDVRVNSGNSVQELKRINSEANRTESSVKGLTSAVTSLVTAIGAVSAAKFVFAKTAELESQAKSLEVLTGSAEDAKRIIEELQAFGAVTPFTSAELIETSKRLQAFGVDAERVVEVTQRLADASGATGAELDGVATAYGQVVAKGRLQTEELLQLQERGIGVQQELQDMYNLSGEELAKAISKGQVSAEAFEVAIERLTEKGGKYAGGAIAQSDTLNGKFSTLQDNVDQLARTIGQVLSPVIKSVLNEAINAIGVINNLLAKGAEAEFTKDVFWTRIKLGAGATSQAVDDIAKSLDKVTFGSTEAEIAVNLQALQKFQRLLQSVGADDPNAKRAEQLQGTIFNLIQKNLDSQQKLNDEAGKLDSPLIIPTLTEGSGQAKKLTDELAKSYDEGQNLITSFTRQSELLNTSVEAERQRLQIQYDYQDRAEQIAGLKDLEQQTVLTILNDEIKRLELAQLQTEELDKQKKAYLEMMEKAAEFAKDPKFSTPFTDARKHSEALREELELLTSGLQIIKDSSAALGQAFSDAFTTAMTEATNAQEVLAGFFDSLANSFIDMAARMIQAAIEMMAFNILNDIFNPVSSVIPGAAELAADPFGGNVQLAIGGARANGGTVMAGNSYLVGERGPEIFTPGVSGGIATGVSGVGNVTVNVDASGSSVQGDSSQANMLGAALGAAVQAELIKQKRPGGLLA